MKIFTNENSKIEINKCIMVHVEYNTAIHKHSNDEFQTFAKIEFKYKIQRFIFNLNSHSFKKIKNQEKKNLVKRNP